MSAMHLLSYLFLACCKAIFAENYVSLVSVVVHTSIVLAVLAFVTLMFTVSFKRPRQTA